MAEPASEDRSERVHALLENAGLSLRREGGSSWRSAIDTWGEELPLVIRLSEHWLELTLDPFLERSDAAPVPDALRLELLRLNRDLRLMKFGVSGTGAVVLSAEMLTDHLDLQALQAVLGALTSTIEEHRPRLAMLLQPAATPA